MATEKIKKADQTYEWALAQMKKPRRYDGEVTIRDIAQRHKTDELMTVAFINGHIGMKEIPAHLLTYEVVLQAVQNHSCRLHIKHIPTEFVTRELVLAYICKETGGSTAINTIGNYVPRELITREFVSEIVRTRPGFYDDNAILTSQFLYENGLDRRHEDRLAVATFHNYTANDIRLAMEALCPQELGEELARHRWGTMPEFASDEEKHMFMLDTMQERYVGPGYAPQISYKMLWMGLNALLKEKVKKSQPKPACKEWDWTQHYDAFVGNLDDEMSLKAVETAVAARRIAMHKDISDKNRDVAFTLTRRLESLDGMGMTMQELTYALLELVEKFGLDAINGITNKELEELLYEEVAYSWDGITDSITNADMVAKHARHKENEFSAIIKHVCDECGAAYLVRYKAQRTSDGNIVPEERVVLARKCSCNTEDEPWDDKPTFEDWVAALNTKYGRKC